RVGGLVRQVLLAGEEPDHRPALLRDLIPNRAEQGRVIRLQCIQHRALGDLAAYVQLQDATDTRQNLQVGRQDDLDHESVCTSTESTPGRSRTMGAQVSPPSGDA